jgi:D-glycero-D-manno-heptose 1,7-bisphosphate phosphatase
VFLDRDDTVIVDPGYISDPSMVRLIDGAAGAIASLAAAGYATVIVTNQSGVARGMLTEETLERIHTELRRQLAVQGTAVDAIYYCPYHPEGSVSAYCRDSDLRKPSPGMLLAAAKDLSLDLAQSWMVGDSRRDIEAGRRAGCRTVLVGAKDDPDAGADFRAADLAGAARLILGR